jgi:hypothetical protein
VDVVNRCWKHWTVVERGSRCTAGSVRVAAFHRLVNPGGVTVGCERSPTNSYNFLSGMASTYVRYFQVYRIHGRY